ncbi:MULTISPECIES: AlbA family DNA-binding domain-containing protein [Hansschlegelia]|uniref:ATP-binding protein n=1 Tax=Hansschlegelia zhihuaiae TaxID=405005 RepID=A0A4Q0ME60_9HYPH|nr:ATP-binding protein [Hansschlegelia zhihuaiae]RXF71514.1 ATP-binding protein [Hansschlegelia zhihuaiae]
MPDKITREMIESRAVVEGPELDFKREIDLADEKARVGFLDDIVAFLNARGGALVVGVAEKKGGFEHWRPLHADPDELGRKIQSLVQTGVDPTPLGVSTYEIALDGDGYALVVAIAEHRMQPYQNRLNGAFRVRTDKQNKVLPRTEIGAYFKRFEDYRATLSDLSQRESEALAQRGVMVEGAPRLTISILPREHFDDHAPLRVEERGRLFPGPTYSGRSDVFRGAPGGYEILTPTMNGANYHRLFVADDWFVQASIVHALYSTQGEGRLALYEMREELTRYFEGLVELFADNTVSGPFAIEAAFTDLRIEPGLGRFFRHDGPARWVPRQLIETLDPGELAKALYETAYKASIY